MDIMTDVAPALNYEQAVQAMDVIEQGVAQLEAALPPDTRPTIGAALTQAYQAADTTLRTNPRVALYTGLMAGGGAALTGLAIAAYLNRRKLRHMAQRGILTVRIKIADAIAP